MPNEVRFNVPFIPQTGITEQILAAIQLANQEKQMQQQMALQQQGQPSLIAQREAEASRNNALTELDKMNMSLRRDLIGSLTGNTPGAIQPVQPAAATPAPNPSAGGPAIPQALIAGALPGQGQPPQSGADILRNLAAQQVTAAQSPTARRGLIAQVMNEALSSIPNLSPAEKQAIITAGHAATLKAFADPQNALDGITSTINDIVKEKGLAERSINTDIITDSLSKTGYSKLGTRPDGSEAYRHDVAPPLPKSLEEATSLLGSAQFNYSRDPSPGNKTALDLFKSQHDAMYAQHMNEVAQTARVSAQARGADYEAMIRTGVNPITKEKLSLNNAPPGSLVNPSTGQPIPQDMISLYKPTQQERQTADTARQVLAISQDLKNEIAKNPNLIGALTGLKQEALQKVGLSARDAARLIDDVTFLQSAATKMHTGRFSSQILDKMSGIIKPNMNANEFLGSLDSVNDVAGRYANEDKLTTVYEYQQRQQFEQQSGAALPTGAVAGSLNGVHGYVLNGVFHKD